MTNPIKNIDPKQALALLIERLTEDFNKNKHIFFIFREDQTAQLSYIYEMNKRIRTLKNMQIDSFEEFESVKTIIKLEQFASNNFFLDDFNFCFPDYKSSIHSDLFNHANIDIHLDNLHYKYQELMCRGHEVAAEKMQYVVKNVKKLNDVYFTQHTINYEQYKKEALRVINDSRSILEQHRGFKKILGNLTLFILTMGFAFLINKSCTGHFLFFKQTDSAKLLNSLTTGIAFSSN